MSKQGDRLRTILLPVIKAFGGRARKRVRANVSGRILKADSGRAGKSVFTRVKKLRDGGFRSAIGFPPKTAWYMRFFEVSGAKPRVAGRGFTVDKRTGLRRKTKALRIPIGGGKFIFRKRTRGFAPQPILFPGVEKELKLSEDDILDAMEFYLLDGLPADGKL